MFGKVKFYFGKSKFMVVCGRFDQGFKFYGPFESDEEAYDFGATLNTNCEWWIETLIAASDEIFDEEPLKGGE